MSWLWDFIIVALVLGVSLGSAVLPVSAIRHWRGAWRKSAFLPLILLFIWLLLLIQSLVFSDALDRLWALELFAWAMFTLIYMVSAMTIKRIFEKKDKEDSPSP